MKEELKQYLTVPIRNDRKPLQDLLPLDRPLRLLIDPSDICNFRCKFCFQSHGKFKGEVMSFETFDRIIEQLKEFDGPINVIHMYGLGEPLINNNLPDFIRIINDNHLAREVAITTNGSLLTHDMADRLVASGLSRLSVSLDGIDDETFRQIVGVEVSFKKIYEQLSYFYSIRGKCHFHVKINGEDYSEDQKDRFVELFKDITDSINIDHVVNVWPGLDVASNGDRMYDYNLDALKNDTSKAKAVCPLMFYELLVHSDGSVSPCAVDYGFKSMNLGNIFDNSLFNIWNGKRLRDLRIESLKGEGYSYSICNKCNYTECAATVNITPFRENLLHRFGE